MRVPKVDRAYPSLHVRLECSIKGLIPALELGFQHLLSSFPSQPSLVNCILVQEGLSTFLRFLHGLVCHTGHRQLLRTQCFRVGVERELGLKHADAGPTLIRVHVDFSNLLNTLAE